MTPKAPKLPPFTRHQGSPVLARGQEGIAIRVSLLPGGERWLFGTCRASRKTAQELRDTLLHNVSIVCTWGPEFVPHAFPVVGTRLVFPEDIDEEPEAVTAFFNLALHSCGVPSAVGRGFVVASFHTFLSNVIELTRS